MAVIDNTLAAQVPTFNPATPLAEAAQLQSADTANRVAAFKQAQLEIGSEARGLQTYVNTPEFAQKWGETADRLYQKGLLNEQGYKQWRNTPSPLLLKSMIAATSDPTLDFRKEEAQRQQQNFNTEMDFKREQANKPQFKVIEDANGNKQLVKIDSDGNPSVAPLGGSGAAAPNNPFSAGGKFNNEQGKAAGFTDRMLQSEGILSGVAPALDQEGPPSPGVQDVGKNVAQTGLSKIPGVGNFLISDERQKYEQAKRDFINAQLRRESGAAISPTEFESADKQYFPVPGDSPDVIKQKAANRRAAIEAMGREGGPAYRPKFSFDQNGTIVPTGSTKQGAAKSGPITREEYDKLKPGDQYMAPDGKMRTKR
jgi:hypothetical protein